MKFLTKKTAYISVNLVLAVMLMTSCAEYRIFPQETTEEGSAESLTLQYLKAYPILKASHYLILRDFEEKWQIEDFSISPENNGSKLSYTSSPTATGKGALGIYFAAPETTLIYKVIIDNWSKYNILLLPIFSNDDKLYFDIAIKDKEGKIYERSYLLTQGWNKLEIDLIEAADYIDLRKIDSIMFISRQMPKKPIYIDDIILVEHRKVLLTGADNDDLYAIKEGKYISIGVNGRFQLDFKDGIIKRWFDLEEDKDKKHNLCPYSGLGPFLKEPEEYTMKDVHTQVFLTESKMIKLTADFYSEDKSHPYKTITYKIKKSGSIPFIIEAKVDHKDARIDFALPLDPTADAIIGKINYPTDIEYALIRKAPPNQGVDLIIAIFPASYSQSISCKYIPNKEKNTLTVSFGISGLLEDTIYLEGILVLWPKDIDNITSAEKIIRESLTD